MQTEINTRLYEKSIAKVPVKFRDKCMTIPPVWEYVNLRIRNRVLFAVQMYMGVKDLHTPFTTFI